MYSCSQYPVHSQATALSGGCAVLGLAEWLVVFVPQRRIRNRSYSKRTNYIGLHTKKAYKTDARRLLTFLNNSITVCHSINKYCDVLSH